ncbi:MAG: alkaline phosphatase family protein [Longimicrobiales bacterium]
MARVLLLFLDGVGLGDADPSYNAFAAARLPIFARLLEGRVVERNNAPFHCDAASLVALDAMLGVEGVPQSGTGQAALLTGTNAAQLYGRHFGPWIPTKLRSLVGDESVLALARARHHRVTFANAYPEELVALATSAGGDWSRLPSFLRAGPPLAALGAGVLDRGTADLERGDAVASEITNQSWRERLGRSALPVIEAPQAGRNLARIAAANDLTLFAHYATDYAGHERDLDRAVSALELVDAFLGGLIDALGDTVLIVGSDHGNIEDARVGHTRNPVLCLVAGPGHADIARNLSSLTDVAGTVLRVMGNR